MVILLERKRAHFYEENSQESPPKKTKADYINDENTDNSEERDLEESGMEVNDAKEFEDLSQVLFLLLPSFCINFISSLSSKMLVKLNQ